MMEVSGKGRACIPEGHICDLLSKNGHFCTFLKFHFIASPVAKVSAFCGEWPRSYNTRHFQLKFDSYCNEVAS